MRRMRHVLAATAFAALGTLVAFAQAPWQPAPQQPAPGAPGQGRQGAPGRGGPAGPASFFITSVGKGDGANYGGIAGADAYCAQMAKGGGLETPAGRTWRAYLSQPAAGGQPAVNARDRIGHGLWRNAEGAVIARDLDELHGDTNHLTKETALTEQGEVVNGRGDSPNRHDILTGSQPDGTAFAGAEDRTCGNWTRSGAEGAAMVGHHDRRGLRDDAPSRSWNASHPSRGGCSQEALRGTGGDGLFYCFAAD